MLTYAVLALGLIALVTVQILLSAVIPQEGIAIDQIAGVDELIALEGRLVKTLRLDRGYTSPLFLANLGLLWISLAAGNIPRLRRAARAKRAVQRTRHLGSALFHLALLAVLLGVQLNFLFRFEGIMGLTVGQALADLPDGYFRIKAGPRAMTRQNDLLSMLCMNSQIL